MSLSHLCVENVRVYLTVPLSNFPEALMQRLRLKRLSLDLEEIMSKVLPRNLEDLTPLCWTRAVDCQSHEIQTASGKLKLRDDSEWNDGYNFHIRARVIARALIKESPDLIV